MICKSLIISFRGIASVAWPAACLFELRSDVTAMNVVLQGEYQVKPKLPFIPGSEVSGVVEAVGAGVTRFQPGDKVTLHGTECGKFEEHSSSRGTHTIFWA